MDQQISLSSMKNDMIYCKENVEGPILIIFFEHQLFRRNYRNLLLIYLSATRNVREMGPIGSMRKEKD